MSLRQRERLSERFSLGFPTLLLSAFLAACAPASTTPLPNAAETAAGTVVGAVADGVRSFKGIPYAAPPVGEARWQAPQSVTAWAEPRQAAALGADCAQAPGEAEPIQTTPAEDCLFLNVWQPETAAPDAGLPVMVWVHGGGFVGGGSSIPWYDGAAFARQDVVVVSFNYRLGRLGFFAHPALLEAAEGPVGNFGLMDQLAALRWVEENIAAFGGNPDEVTLVGQSAGGASVLALLTAPEANGLFDRAMVLSGGGRRGLLGRPIGGGTADAPSADQTDALYAGSLGVTGSGPDALAALRALPAEQVQGDLNLERLAQGVLLGVPGAVQGTQIVGGALVSADPGELLGSDVPNVPVVIGTTAVDLPNFFPPRTDPLSYFGADAEAARAAYGAPAQLDQESLTRLLLSIGTDLTMHEPARYVARQMTAKGNSVWLYRFTYTAEATRPDAPAQSHAGELPFMFDRLAARYGAAATAKDQETATAFSTYVANFVKNGDPNGAGVPTWPAFDPAGFDLLNFTLDNGPVYGPDPLSARIELVERATEAQP